MVVGFKISNFQDYYFLKFISNFCFSNDCIHYNYVIVILSDVDDVSFHDVCDTTKYTIENTHLNLTL